MKRSTIVLIVFFTLCGIALKASSGPADEKRVSGERLGKEAEK